MTDTRLGPDRISFGVADEGALPMRAGGGAALESLWRPLRGWTGVALRLLRNAAIAVAVMTTVPIVIVGSNGDSVWRLVNNQSIQTKTAITERTRPFALPKDPWITPIQAGLAFNMIHSVRSLNDSRGFTPVVTPQRPARSWESLSIAPDMFPTARPDVYKGPSSNGILEAVAAGFSKDESEYLQRLATAPVWREFRYVATAQAVDFIGGRFELPFGADASYTTMPIMPFKTTKELAYAAVSRAAWFMSVGQRDSAETTLRGIISFGFALVDNGTNAMEQMTGNVIVGIGREALRRFYTITGDPRAASPALAAPTLASAAGKSSLPSGVRTADEMRAWLLARVADPTAHRGARFEALHALSVSSCTNVRELLFGPGDDITRAVASARQSLARYPSERALIDISAELPRIRIRDLGPNPLQGLAVSSAAVAGVVFQNPRLATCSLVASQRYYRP